MSDVPPLSSEARAALDALRGAHDPDPDVAPRLRGALDVTLRAHARRALAAKVSAAALVVAALGAWWLRGRASVRPPSVAPSVALAPSVAVAPSAAPSVAVVPSVAPSVMADATGADAGAPMVRNTNDRVAVRPVVRPRCALDDELRAIRAADASLRAGDARGSLRVAQDLARRCPDGALVEEREAVRVMSLCALHDPGRARAAERFRATWPRSPARDRIAALCGDEL